MRRPVDSPRRGPGARKTATRARCVRGSLRAAELRSATAVWRALGDAAGGARVAAVLAKIAVQPVELPRQRRRRVRPIALAPRLLTITSLRLDAAKPRSGARALR